MKYFIFLLQIVFVLLIILYFLVLFIGLYGMGGHAMPIIDILISLFLISLLFSIVLIPFYILIKYMIRHYEDD